MKSVEDAEQSLVGARLLAVRKHMDLTQAQFADGAKVGKNAYQQAESGNQPLSRDMLVKLCVRYGLTADFVLFGELHTLPFQMAQALSSSESDSNSKSSADTD